MTTETRDKLATELFALLIRLDHWQRGEVGLAPGDLTPVVEAGLAALTEVVSEEIDRAMSAPIEVLDVPASLNARIDLVPAVARMRRLQHEFYDQGQLPVARDAQEAERKVDELLEAILIPLAEVGGGV